MYRNLTRLSCVLDSCIPNALTRKLYHHSSGAHFPLLHQFRFSISLPNLHTPKSVTIRTMADHVDKSDLRNRLTPIQYNVTQEKGTERPFSGCYNKTYDAGTYLCVVCEQPLFSSDTKYDSGCGWPAFNDVLDQGKVKLSPDTSGVGGNLLLLISQPGRIRTEVTCSKCGAHLGHVFNDGPPPKKKSEIPFAIGLEAKQMRQLFNFHESAQFTELWAAGSEKDAGFVQPLAPAQFFTSSIVEITKLDKEDLLKNTKN